MRFDDFLLFTVVFSSGAAAVLFPGPASVLQPFILYFMMLILFLSFLRIDFRALLDTSGRNLMRLGMLAFVKLIGLPALLYWGTFLILPDYAVPVLLLSGISTGVVAPFIATLVAADVTQVLKMVIVTSLVVPFTLPPLVKLLAGADIAIPLSDMIQLLAIVVFVPIGAVLVVRRFFPSLPAKILAKQFPLALLLFALVNLGVFSQYSDFFFQNPGQLGLSVAIAYALSVIYYMVGFLLTQGRGLSERLAVGVSLGIMNNVLVIVFSSRFFGPLAPTLAAMYMFPFYTMIVPLRLIGNPKASLSMGAPDKP